MLSQYLVCRCLLCTSALCMLSTSSAQIQSYIKPYWTKFCTYDSHRISQIVKLLSVLEYWVYILYAVLSFVQGDKIYDRSSFIDTQKSGCHKSLVLHEIVVGYDHAAGCCKASSFYKYRKVFIVGCCGFLFDKGGCYFALNNWIYCCAFWFIFLDNNKK